MNDKRMLYANGYVNIFLKNICPIEYLTVTTSVLKNSEKLKWRSIPYIVPVFEATTGGFSKYDAKLAHKPTSTLRGQVMRPNNPLEKSDKSTVAYSIYCKD